MRNDEDEKIDDPMIHSEPTLGQNNSQDITIPNHQRVDGLPEKSLRESGRFAKGTHVHVPGNDDKSHLVLDGQQRLRT